MVITIKIPDAIANVFKWIETAAKDTYNWIVNAVKLIAKFVKYVLAFKA